MIRRPGPPLPPGGLEGDLAPLQEEGHWGPKQILERFGVAQSDQDQLPRLLAAVAVLLGPGRIAELATRLLHGFAALRPSLQAILHLEALRERHDLVKQMLDRIKVAEVELESVRGRAQNDLVGRPGGLRGTELAYLILGLRSFVLATEVSRRRTPIGFADGLVLALSPPVLAYVEEWAVRLFGTTHFEGFQLFWPPDYRRTILVYDDGHLAYDPKPDDVD